MKDNLLPEEKLLRLIRGEKNTPPAGVSRVIPVIESQPSVKKHRFYFLLGRLDYSFINKLLSVILTVSAGYLFIAFSYPWWASRKIELPKPYPGKSMEQRSVDKSNYKPYEFYSNLAAGRQIFLIPTAKENEVPAVKGEATLIQDINLLGIISGDNPQAVIEDKKAQKTYNVTKGQLVGDFQVEDIQDGKIILNSKGQRYELNM